MASPPAVMLTLAVNADQRVRLMWCECEGPGLSRTDVPLVSVPTHSKMLCVTKMTQQPGWECTKYMHVTATRCCPPEPRPLLTLTLFKASQSHKINLATSCMCVISPEGPEGLVLPDLCLVAWSRSSRCTLGDAVVWEWLVSERQRTTRCFRDNMTASKHVDVP